MSKIIEIIFHNAEELKNKMDELEPKIEGKHNALRLNLTFITGNTGVEEEYFVLKDKNNKIFSKVKWDNIFSLMIYSDENKVHSDPDDYEHCYSFINHKIQFLDEEERIQFGFEIVKESLEDDEYFLPDKLRDEVSFVLSKGSGAFVMPVDENKLESIETGIISEEDFIRLVQKNMKK